jgi:probable phosphoglycerate mutase
LSGEEPLTDALTGLKSKANRMTTTLVLIRHGQTEWNREGRIQGHLDSALTPEGIAQAEACATRLATEPFDALYASDLPRTQHTAAILNCALHLTMNSRESLRERCFGIGEGLTYAEMDVRFPEVFSRARALDPDFAIEGGETRRQFHSRVRTALQGIASAHAGQRVLVVTHGGVLGVVYRWLNDLPIASAHTVEIPNVAYNRVRVADSQWQLEIWGDTAHLAFESSEAG